MEQKNSNSTLLAITGIIAILALILAWTAFNRTGQDLEDMVADQVEEAYNTSERAVVDGAQAIEDGTEELVDDATLLEARAEARAELIVIEARIEAGEEINEIQADLDAIETDLEQAYANAGQEATQEWNDLQIGLQNIEDGLRTGTAETLEFIGGTVLLLEDDVRYDD
jgi:ElaB/YqjD/DUF883 family membrane-anchored ribosome-binding protein